MFSVSAIAWMDMPAANESMTSNSRSVNTALAEVWFFSRTCAVRAISNPSPHVPPEATVRMAVTICCSSDLPTMPCAPAIDAFSAYLSME